MATLSECDVCDDALDRPAVAGIRFADGAMRGTEKLEPRFVESSRPSDHVVCERCAAYFMRCIEWRASVDRGA